MVFSIVKFRVDAFETAKNVCFGFLLLRVNIFIVIHQLGILPLEEVSVCDVMSAAEPGMSRCPLCHCNIVSSEQSWRTHLMSPGDDGCPQNARRKRQLQHSPDKKGEEVIIHQHVSRRCVRHCP